MADLDLEWGGDLTIGPTGDLVVTSGNAETDQHILRRLLTPVKGYVWHLEYGAGLVQHIGNVASVANIQALVRASIKLEASVQQSPPPTVTVDEDESVSGLFNIQISYVSTLTGEASQISYDLTTR